MRDSLADLTPAIASRVQPVATHRRNKHLALLVSQVKCPASHLLSVPIARRENSESSTSSAIRLRVSFALRIKFLKQEVQLAGATQIRDLSAFGFSEIQISNVFALQERCTRITNAAAVLMATSKISLQTKIACRAGRTQSWVLFSRPSRRRPRTVVCAVRGISGLCKMSTSVPTLSANAFLVHLELIAAIQELCSRRCH